MNQQQIPLKKYFLIQVGIKQLIFIYLLFEQMLFGPLTYGQSKDPSYMASSILQGVGSHD
jgi:hypothetical protein